jgi:hypothetical protein
MVHIICAYQWMGSIVEKGGKKPNQQNEKKDLK